MNEYENMTKEEFLTRCLFLEEVVEERNEQIEQNEKMTENIKIATTQIKSYAIALDSGNVTRSEQVILIQQILSSCAFINNCCQEITN